MRRNVAGQFVGIQMVSKTDGSAVTTGTTTVYVTGDAGTQAAGSVGSGACTHEGNGFWTYAPAQAETNYTHVAFTFVNTSAVNSTLTLRSLPLRTMFLAGLPSARRSPLMRSSDTSRGGA